MKRKKPKLPKPRNPYTMPARKRKAGPHKNKRDKRVDEVKGDKKWKEEIEQ